MPTPKPKRITTPASQRLSTITEGAAAQPTSPPPPSQRLTNLSTERRLHLGDPPAFNLEKAPPGYTADYTRPQVPPSPSDEGDGTFFSGVRKNLHRRGGWKRLALLLALLAVILLAIALGVGLGVGLNSSSSSSSSSPSSTHSSTAAREPFPVGNWTISTFLATVTTSCVADSSYWWCYPGTTYAASPTLAAFAVNWEITASPHHADRYTLAPGPNPFTSLSFPATALTRVAAGTEQERYTFSIERVLKVDGTYIGSRSASCFFNATALSGVLYAKRKPTYSSKQGGGMEEKGGLPGDAQTEYRPWPGAVSIKQTAEAGGDVPNCFHNKGDQVVGGRVSVPTKGKGMCECGYTDYGGGV